MDPHSKSPRDPKNPPTLLLTWSPILPTSVKYIPHRVLCRTSTLRKALSEGRGDDLLLVASSCRYRLLDARTYVDSLVDTASENAAIESDLLEGFSHTAVSYEKEPGEGKHPRFKIHLIVMTSGQYSL